MNLQKTPIAIAAVALFAAAPFAAYAAPTVSISSPTAGSTVSGILQGSACEARGTNIARVKFYFDTTLLSTDDAAPWQCSVDTRRFTDGRHRVRVVAYDRAGVANDASVYFNVQNGTSGGTTPNTPPTVSISAPGSGATVSGTVNCGATASDSNSIKQVVFTLDGAPLSTDSTSPYACSFDSTKLPNGTHTLKAEATDGLGATNAAQVSFTVNNTVANSGPTVSWKTPADGAKLSGSLSSCETTATDSNGIQKVDYFLGNTRYHTEFGAPYTCGFDTKKFPDGAYVLKAVATDKLGASNSAQINVTIANNTTAPTNTPPTVGWKTPADGAKLSGSLSSCETTATDSNGIQKVDYFLGNTRYHTEFGAPYTCGFDTKKFPDGAYVLKAVATDKLGASNSAQINVTIANNTTAPTNTPPVVNLTSPATGATLAGSVAYAATASDTGGSVTKVEFYLTPSTQTAALSSATAPAPFATKTATPYSGTLDTSKVANGSYTLMAVATDNLGAVATTQRPVTVSNLLPDTGGGGSGGSSAIAAADILTHASADVSFAQQSGYTAQVINTFTSAAQMPESGIHGSELPNGETLRFGKVSDPMDSVRKALAFQVKNSDPTTSGGKRAELKANNNIEMNKVYWIAFSAYIYDWGTLSTTDKALFGTQVHQGKSGLEVGGPTVGLYTTQDGRSFRVQARYSESSTPTESNSVWVRYAEYPIPFGRWADFVFKFKHNTSGNGFLQVWMDGNEIANHQGSLGYNTGVNDYIKFGYYNWSGSAMGSTARKLLLRSPTLVADPTGNTYSAEQLRALVQPASTSTTTTAGTTTDSTSSTSGTTTTTSGGGVCSTVWCAATQ